MYDSSTFQHDVLPDSYMPSSRGNLKILPRGEIYVLYYRKACLRTS